MEKQQALEIVPIIYTLFRRLTMSKDNIIPLDHNQNLRTR